MIQITPQVRILAAVEAIDFRKGIDSLVQVCRDIIGSDPFSGYMFVFRNRKRTALMILTYDGQGFWLCKKRLSQGRFQFWPDRVGDRASQLAAHELQLLIWNGDPQRAYTSPFWKRIPT